MRVHAPRGLQGNRKSNAPRGRRGAFGVSRTDVRRRQPFFFFFFLRVARDSRTPTRTGSTRACQSESARGFCESYRILRPAKLPLTTDARARTHADRALRERTSVRPPCVGFTSVLEVLKCPHIFRETKRPSAP